MKKSVQIERLTQLIRVLEEVKASKKPFYMQTWHVPLSLMGNEEKGNIVGNKKHSCGTASCAAGWAAQDPWFKRRGFTLGKVDKEFDFIHNPGVKVVKMRGDGEEFDACNTFFGESELFSPSGYPIDHDKCNISPSMVIKRVKDLIKSLQAGVGA